MQEVGFNIKSTLVNKNQMFYGQNIIGKNRHKPLFSSQQQDRVDFKQNQQLNPSASQTLTDFLKQAEKICRLSAIASVSEWDKMTGGLPSKAFDDRSQDNALLSVLIHQTLVSPIMKNLLNELNRPDVLSNLKPIHKAMVREFKKSYDEAAKFTDEQVKQRSKTFADAYKAWEDAKSKDNFYYFSSHLENVINWQKESLKILGKTEKPPYDELLDPYSPGLTTDKLDSIFSTLKDKIVPLVKEIEKAKQKNPKAFNVDFKDRFVDLKNPTLAKKKIEDFRDQILKDMGFDFSRGKVATSPHPFTNGMKSPLDVRLTHWPIPENPKISDLAEVIMATLHEGGHALVEQGSDPALLNTGLTGAYIDLHEGLSRFWENQIGRSEAFWQHYFPILQETLRTETVIKKSWFGSKVTKTGPLDDVTLKQFVLAINDVKPSFIRVEADEVTYNLHIMLRYELEKEMVNAKTTEDLQKVIVNLPTSWNKKMMKYLELVPVSNKEGALQDMHWSSGVGYFPAYSIGNLEASQIYNKVKKEIPDLEGKIAKGDFKELKSWLDKNIHKNGMVEKSQEVIKKATGEELNPQYYIDYLDKKFARLYGLEKH